MAGSHDESTAPQFLPTPGQGGVRRIAANLLPGVALPGLVYFVVSRSAPVLIALAAASAVPAAHAVLRLLRRRRPSAYGLVFLVLTGCSVGLAVWLHSPMFILARGAVLSGLLGLAFAVSALVKRPLTRTFALFLSEEHRDGRRRLAARWSHPKVTSVFTVLAGGWAALLILSAAQQAALIVTVSPGTVMAVEPPVQAFVTLAGTVLSVLYVRRAQRRHAEVRLLPSS